jgi:mono/diheme cytochrome c family protein
MMRWLVTILIAVVIVIVVGLILLSTLDLSAGKPSGLETSFMTRIKYWRIGGKSVNNPSPDTPDTIKEGAEHFQHHCEICHGLDGQGTGVPIASRTSPPVADLASARVQHYTDGQLKWIIDNGLRFSGMPGFKGILEDDESWAIIRYIRHLPPKGSLGAPKVFQEAEEEHEHGTENQGQHTQGPGHDHGAAEHQQPHQH